MGFSIDDLYDSIRSNNADRVFAILLQHPAWLEKLGKHDSTFANEGNWSPLGWAVSFRKIQVVELLLDIGASVDSTALSSHYSHAPSTVLDVALKVKGLNSRQQLEMLRKEKKGDRLTTDADRTRQRVRMEQFMASKCPKGASIVSNEVKGQSSGSHKTEWSSSSGKNNETDGYSADDLYESIGNNDADKVFAILLQHPAWLEKLGKHDSSFANEGNWSPLGWAVSYCKIEVVELLLDIGASVYAIGHSDHHSYSPATPLEIANGARGSDSWKQQCMLRKEKEGVRLVTDADRARQRSRMELFMAAKSPEGVSSVPNGVTTTSQKTSGMKSSGKGSKTEQYSTHDLYEAIKANDVDKVYTVLLQYPSWLELIGNGIEWTPLGWAAINNKIEVVELLLDIGASVHSIAHEQDSLFGVSRNVLELMEDMPSAAHFDRMRSMLQSEANNARVVDKTKQKSRLTEFETARLNAIALSDSIDVNNGRTQAIPVTQPTAIESKIESVTSIHTPAEIKKTEENFIRIDESLYSVDPAHTVVVSFEGHEDEIVIMEKTTGKEICEELLGLFKGLFTDDTTFRDMQLFLRENQSTESILAKKEEDMGVPFANGWTFSEAIQSLRKYRTGSGEFSIDVRQYKQASRVLF